jgi:hypothetical protein
MSDDPTAARKVSTGWCSARTRRRSPTGSAASGGSRVTPWQPDAVNVASDKLVFRPRLTPIAGRDVWHP